MYPCDLSPSTHSNLFTSSTHLHCPRETPPGPPSHSPCNPPYITIPMKSAYVRVGEECLYQWYIHFLYCIPSTHLPRQYDPPHPPHHCDDPSLSPCDPSLPDHCDSPPPTQSLQRPPCLRYCDTPFALQRIPSPTRHRCEINVLTGTFGTSCGQRAGRDGTVQKAGNVAQSIGLDDTGEDITWLGSLLDSE